MIVNVALTLEDHDDPTMTADQAAKKIMKALDGDETIDTVTVSVFTASVVGTAGPPREENSESTV